MHVAAFKQCGMVNACAGQVCQKHTECNRQKEQRLELLDDSKVQKNTGNSEHNELQRVFAELCEACAIQKISYRFHE